MIVNQSSATAVARSFKALFVKAFSGAAETLFYPKIAQHTTTTAGSVEYNWLAQIPGMKKLRGAAEKVGLQLITWVITNDEWHDTIAVKEADMERDQLGLYNQRFEMLGDAAARHPDELSAEALLNGFSTKDYTGKNFFDTGKKHFPGAKNTFDNKRTDALSATTYAAARKDLKQSKIVFPDGSEQNLKLGRQLCLIVGPANEDAARTILKADKIENGKTNIHKDTAELEVWPELGDSAAWFLFDKAHMAKPLIFQEEKKPVLNSCTNPKDSYVIENHEFLHQAYGRYAVGYFLPQLIIGSTGG